MATLPDRDPTPEWTCARCGYATPAQVADAHRRLTCPDCTHPLTLTGVASDAGITNHGDTFALET